MLGWPWWETTAEEVTAESPSAPTAHGRSRTLADAANSARQDRPRPRTSDPARRMRTSPRSRWASPTASRSTARRSLKLDIHQDLDASTPERPADDAPTAEEIMRALEAEQRAAKATSDTGSLRTAHGPRSARSPHRPSTRRPHHRRLLPPPRWAIACSLLAAGLGVLAVQLASGTGPNPGGHPTRALASGATAPTSGLIEAAMNSFLGAEHAVDHRLNPPRARTARTSRPRRPHHQLARVPNSTSPARSPSQSTSTASTTGASDSTGTTEQISQTSSTPSSSSTSSGSSQPPPTNQSQTAPHSNSSSLRHPIQSGPPFAGHWSRQLQLPIARTHRTSTGR